MSDHQSPRILIVRLSAIGDVVHGLPVLCALRDHYRRAHLTWVVEGRAAELLRGHPALDRLIVVPRRWLKSPAAVWRLRRELRQLRPDVAIDVQSLTKSAVAGWLSGAPRRIGFGGVDGRELSPWLNNERVEATAAHVIERNLELLRPLGVRRSEIRFDLPEDYGDAQAIGRFVRQRGLGHGFAVINPGAGWPSKRWPVERFAEVARFLGQQRNLPTVVVWAGADERRWADQIITTAGGHAHLAPPTSLRELAALARRARLFLASDTGPLHIAAAVGTPCVGLYGPVPAERNGPYGSQHVALQNVRLEGSNRARRRASDGAMRAISTAEVCAACEQVLDRPSDAPPRPVPQPKQALAA